MKGGEEATCLNWKLIQWVGEKSGGACLRFKFLQFLNDERSQINGEIGKMAPLNFYVWKIGHLIMKEWRRKTKLNMLNYFTLSTLLHSSNSYLLSTTN